MTDVDRWSVILETFHLHSSYVLVYFQLRLDSLSHIRAVYHPPCPSPSFSNFPQSWFHACYKPFSSGRSSCHLTRNSTAFVLWIILSKHTDFIIYVIFQYFVMISSLKLWLFWHRIPQWIRNGALLFRKFLLFNAFPFLFEVKLVDYTLFVLYFFYCKLQIGFATYGPLKTSQYGW